ncbi:DNA-3-methyladenine glycosylase I [Spiroplasma taiwanense]|uniref:DNA-3-methyladenine glycosidase I n=1 Tax=Spiroplasma taiwanense CT-1 TaxID=1276220 RepID=S5MGU9_9MOLU|nr:DNA-3-methyladenine glycosylase I [Spiroplasma taiwanense]AGR41075.1 DNA-3-methyladenine glycosidase I [Spiroplasma taiwanense CT-1]
MNRCQWAEGNEILKQYHDIEWGVCVYDDVKLFEILNLECMQAGLSWLIVLKKRNSYKIAFDHWNYKLIEKYDENKISLLMNNVEIIRSLNKIKAIIMNAKAFIEIQNEFETFSNYIWQFVNNKQIVNNYETINQVPAYSDLSNKISLDLKKRGFKYTGKTRIYSFLQACGIINDHIDKCDFKIK